MRQPAQLLPPPKQTHRRDRHSGHHPQRFLCHPAERSGAGGSDFARACPLFVPLVENGYVNGDKVTQLMIEEYLTPVRDSGIDTLILGCTHYPLLKK